MKANVVFRFWRPLIVAAVFTTLAISARSETLVQWDFNTQPPDPTNSFPTGTLVPIFGTGTAALVGGATSTFASGTGSSDPVTVDDSAWNTAGYPAQGNGNKTRGVQFNVSTEGFQQIRVTWDHRNSGTSSRYIRFQYSTNGTDFIDGPVLSNTVQDVFSGKIVDLTSVAVVNNKSNFAFRIVAEFESTATGAGAAQYVATTTGQTYSPNGTWRFDMVTVSGEIFSGDSFPTISTVSNQTIRMNTLSDEIPFTVGDVETPATDLIVAATSSDQQLIADADIFLGGMDANRTIRFFPAADRSGTATITLTVTDASNQTTSTSFLVTVLPDNTPPTISSFTNYHTVVNVPRGPIAFSIGDAETAPGDLTLSASSSNPFLVTDVVFGGSGGNRTLTVIPNAEQTGNAVITVTVSDGTLTASRQFALMVVPSSSVVLCDSFTYADGPLNSVSAFRWANHSGIAGQTEVTSQSVRLSSADTEDISAILIGAPYTPASRTVLYAGFTVNMSTEPTPLGEYFAHFRGLANTGPFFARIFAMNTNAGSQTFLLGIGNAATVSNAVIFPRELPLNSNHVVVVRYDVAAGTSTLWVNPTSETDTSVGGADTVTPAPVLAWAFRQSSTDNGNMGMSSIDDLKVGLSFADVIPGHRLRIKVNAPTVEVSWSVDATDQGFLLESATDITAGDWQLVASVPERANGRDRVTLSRSQTNNTFFRLAK